MCKRGVIYLHFARLPGFRLGYNEESGYEGKEGSREHSEEGSGWKDMGLETGGSGGGWSCSLRHVLKIFTWQHRGLGVRWSLKLQLRLPSAHLWMGER